MKYREIIGLHDYFQPNFDIIDEVGDYWKQFIPNKKFFNALTQTLSSLEKNKADEKKSLWLQGTYGTGKSHVTAVIKHLLYDDLENVQGYIENFEDIQLKHRLNNFKKNHKVFPVLLKGTSSITDNRTFALEIEKAVKSALENENISISTKSDFEKMVYQIEENPAHIDWDANIKNSELKIYVNNKNELIAKLKMGDTKILRISEQMLSEKRLYFSYSKITDWLFEVKEELNNRKIADSLIIYWDEFTSILQHPSRSILLTEIQNIADLSVNRGVYLFVVSHRRVEQLEFTEKDIKKIQDRFKLLDYAMESITTYHIIGASIKKVDKDKWEVLKIKHLEELDGLIRRIVGSEGVNVLKNIKNLFPIHPYTAYLSTFIARHIGSTERSIFNFLYDDDKKGFKNFIEKDISDSRNIFLTVDYLWDYFCDEFERIGDERISAALDKYKLHKDSVDYKGEEYVAVFKSIFILNILYRSVELSESSLVAPSTDNIKACFQGTNYFKFIDNILEFLDKEQIIVKTPDNLFLVQSSVLPFREIEEEKKKSEGQYKEIKRIFNSDQLDEIKNIFKTSIRITEIEIFDAGLKEHLLRNMLRKAFKQDYAIHLAVFIGRSKKELEQIKIIINKLKNDEEFNNMVFAIIDTYLDDNTYNKFIEYKARAIVADKHNYGEERNINENYAKKILDVWITNISTEYLDWHLKNTSEKLLINTFKEKIDNELSKEIFKNGLENITETTKNQNIWTKKKAKASMEIFLFADNREYIENKTLKGPERYLRGIIKDNNEEYIVSTSLDFKQNIGEYHPTKKMDNEIEIIIDQNKNRGIFNLGESLRFLSKPPYGLYSNMINMAVLGFLMRKYIGKLYEAGTGNPIEKEIMREKILSLFNYWENGRDVSKLEMRFGTEEERKLINILNEIFKLTKADSLNDIRWGIRNWIKNTGNPLWVYKVSKYAKDKSKVAIDKIFQLIQSTDKEIDFNTIIEYLEVIDDVKYDLGNLIIIKEEAEDLFKIWLINIENVKINEEEIGQVKDYIKKNMQEEVASWREDKVREKVKDWRLENANKLQEEKGEFKYSTSLDSFTGIRNEGSKNGIVIENENNDKEGIIDIVKTSVKIRNYKGDIKGVLIRIIQKYPEMARFIEREISDEI